jgi:predicted aspartyl protease
VDLVSYLLEAGFRRVALARNGVGHFHAAGHLGGRAVAVLVDTGAASTVVALSLARELGLALTELPTRGGGAGGVQLAIFKVEGAALALDGATPRPRGLVAMDLTHVNQALALKGEPPVDVILGADVLEGQAAVIDYGSGSLFLRDP